MKKRQNCKILNASIDEALKYPLTNPRVVVLRNTSAFDTTLAILNHFHTKITQRDSYHQLIMPDRYQASRIRAKHSFKMPKSVLPMDAPETTKQNITVFTVLSWLQTMQSKILTANVPLTLILVEGSEYCVNFETILKVAIYAKQEHNVPLRIIWMPAYKPQTLKIKAEQLLLNCGDTSSEMPIIFSRTDITLNSDCDCIQPILFLIQRIHMSNKPGNIFVVLPSTTALRELKAHLDKSNVSKHYECTQISYYKTASTSADLMPLKKIFLCLASTTLFETYGKVSTLIDASVRKTGRMQNRARKVTLNYSTKSEMKKFFDSLKIGKQEITVHVLITKKTYESLPIYPEKKTEVEDFAVTLLRLFRSKIPAHEIYGQTSSDWLHYIKAIQYLVEFELLELSPSTGQYVITKRGKFTLRSELSFRNARFLFNVLSDPQSWTGENSFVPYLATITTAWLQGTYNLFLETNHPSQRIKMTEYTRDDSLTNALEIYCNYIISFERGIVNRRDWCFHRGIHTPAMRDFFRRADILFVAYTRTWYFPQNLSAIFPQKSRLISYLDTQLESDKKRLEPFLRANFTDCIYSKQRPNDENVPVPETMPGEDNPAVFYNLTTGKSEMLDPYIEPTVFENLKNPEVQFLATQFGVDEQGIERLKKIIIV